MDILTKMRSALPGLALASCMAALAYFAGEFLPLSAMLIALLFGFLLHPVSIKLPAFNQGVNFSANEVLKFGIVCMGARINLSMIVEIGWLAFLSVAILMVITTLSGFYLSRKMGLSHSLSILCAGAVSVCGSAAALALCSLLPQHEKSDTDLVFVIVGVTILSTIGMVLYPVFLSFLPLDSTDVGIILGASLHNVAQTVASGFSVSDSVGENATIIKLMRVSLLAPYVLVVSILIRGFVDTKTPNKRPPILPNFIIGFILVTGLNSIGLIPELITGLLVFLSKACLLISVVAIGIRTAFGQLKAVDPSAIKLLILLSMILFAGSIGLVGLL